MTSDRLFVYGTLMHGFDHPMARMLSRNADFQPAMSGHDGKDGFPAPVNSGEKARESLRL